MKPRVTVITPTYNREHVIERAIRSVLKQTFTDFEYIIVDDGSKDNTKDLVYRIASSLPDQNKDKIKFVQHEVNKGQNAALNTGLSIAKGGYVAFLDSDDEWLPDMLEEQVKQFDMDPEVSCSYTWPGYYNERRKLVTGRRYTIKGYLYKEALDQGYICNPTTLMVKKECFEELGGFKTEFITCQDDDICLRLAKRYKFALVPEIKAIIHSDAGNQTITNRRVYANDWYKLFRKYESDIKELCGTRTFAKHLTKCALLFFQIGEKTKAKEIIAESRRLNASVKNELLYIIVSLPQPIGKAVLGLASWSRASLRRLFN